MIDLVIAGLSAGSAYALIAMCLVLTSKLLGVLNFAVCSFGAFGTYSMVALVGDGMPYPLAFVLGVTASAAVAGIVGLVMTTWFYDATTQVRSSVSIGLLITILAIGLRVFGRSPRSMPAPFDGWTVRLGGVNIAGSTIVLLLGAIIFAALTGRFLRRTDLGVYLRAISQRPVTAELLGVRARTLVLSAWVVSGLVVGVALLFIAPTVPGDFESLSLLVIPSLAGALLAALTHVWVALGGGLVLGIVESLLTRSSTLSTYGQVIPLVVIVLALVWSSRSERWDAAR